MPDNGHHHKSTLMAQGLAEMAQSFVNQNANSSEPNSLLQTCLFCQHTHYMYSETSHALAQRPLGLSCVFLVQNAK